MQPHTPLTTFTIFPSLPAELRLKIWRESCSPRIITLNYNQASDSFASCPQPALLSTCHESREEALRIYTPFFGTNSHKPHIYFNPYRDTIHLPRHGQMGYDDSLRDFKKLVRDETGLLDEVRHVAIDHVQLDIKRPWESYNKAMFLRSFRKLEEVTLVLSNENLPSNKEMLFQDPKVDPERLLRIWYYFRQSFWAEERLLEGIYKDSGRVYEAFTLPTVRIKAKVAKEKVEDLELAFRRTRI
jgi:hypothetical protein